MSHMEDDDPPLKSHPASREYRENFDRIFGEKPTYYAHPLWFYGTEAERADVELIERELGGVLNPNAPEHEAAYFARKKATGKGMDYFLEDVLPGCVACVFRADTDGLVSSGVVLEVNWFVERGLPTYELTDAGLVPATVDPARDMGVEESKRRCRACYREK